MSNYVQLPSGGGGGGGVGPTGPEGPQGPPGIGRWRGSWTSGTPADGEGAYAAQDVVVYQGTCYRANTTPTVGVAPLNSLQWDIVAQKGADGSNGTSGVSFTYQGEWVSGTPYLIGQWVTHNGDLYYCNGNIVSLTALPNLDPGWNLGLSAGGGGVVPGQSPMSAVRANAYLFTVGAGSGGAATTISANSVAASPIFVPEDTTADRLTLYINTGTATALWRLGLYADNGDMYPGALVVDGGTIDAATSGAKEITLGAPVDVPTGVYWVAGKVETAFAAARGTSGPVYGVLPASNSNTADVCSGYLCTYGSAGLPANWPAWGAGGTGTVTTAPRIGVRVTG